MQFTNVDMTISLRGINMETGYIEVWRGDKGYFVSPEDFQYALITGSLYEYLDYLDKSDTIQ
jgi:hypothetical protein